MGGREPLVIPDLNKSELTKEMEVTKAFGGGSLIGAPIILKNGKHFGTLCGMDNVPFDFKEEHINLFKNMATLLTYVIDLDYSFQQVLHISTPIVPVFDGIAILPIIGEIDEIRGEHIIATTIQESHKRNLEHLIVDLSGITNIENEETFYLLNLVNTLKLLGITVIFSGMRPEIAKKAIHSNHNLEGVPFRSNLNQALSYIGVTLTT
ncbi:STAS domain-containing protein [Fictibacillus nanhaiensis]|uniref:STAS domain-containing protein n=1 Tax=Fictibacillus nanhaiensis TaxID=742169 RepID=UPI001C97EAFE|nr:STAS domain-containing protein [Fictibacillus nanhaiensis]MBY6037637.1 STAS domain-containing protein [Fictibacillus nanhaiensis]